MTFYDPLCVDCILDDVSLHCPYHALLVCTPLVCDMLQCGYVTSHLPRLLRFVHHEAVTYIPFRVRVHGLAQFHDSEFMT